MTIRRCVIAVLASLGVALGTPAGAVVADATGLLAVTMTGFVFNHQTNTYDTTVTIKNTSTVTVTAPVQLAVGALPEGVTLANAAGTAQGRPFVVVRVPGDALEPGGIITPIVLKFGNPARVAFTPQLSVSGDVP